MRITAKNYIILYFFTEKFCSIKKMYYLCIVKQKTTIKSAEQHDKHGKKFMTTQEILAQVNVFNQKLEIMVAKAVWDTLRVWARFEAEYYKSRGGWEGCTIKCITNEDIKAQLTDTPLLRAMFADAEMRARLFEPSDSNSWYIEIGVNYKHPRGGSNGLDLMGIEINKDTFEMKVELNTNNF